MVRNVLITGASRGLGKELSVTFARNSWNLIISGRDANLLSQFAAGVRTNGVECDVVIGDIRSEETIRRLGQTARQNDLDVLINNAGIYMAKPFQEATVEEFREIVDTNLIAPVRLIKEIYPIFQQKHSGLIVNVNSLAGLDATSDESAYCASKHGLRGFSDALKIEADKTGIRVLDFYLGAMQTGMTQSRANYSDLMSPTEVADLIYKECSDARQSMRVDKIVVRRRSYRK